MHGREDASGLLIAGTASDAGKSLLVTGICRALARRGVSVAPFKAQNMSNNSMVCLDGSEIGRAQYLQAQAAGVVADSSMNPVLLKPGSDSRSFVIVRGQPAGSLDSSGYQTGRARLAEAAFAAYEELAARFDLVVCEGAGSPAEINLRSGDYVNLGLARRFDLPTVLVGDIDRGGVLAAIFGTIGLLDDADRELIIAYVINKFRGDLEVLRPGLDELSRRTGVPCAGVLPWLRDVWLDAEDSQSAGRWPGRSSPDCLRVSVVRLPRISNATDVDALAAEPGVDVRLVTSPIQVRQSDLVVVPGSRATVSDLGWLRSTGIAEALAERARYGKPVLGICGGFQMLAEIIEDFVEAGVGEVPGIGLLPYRIEFERDKVLARPEGTWQGHRVTAYEIHHGRARLQGEVEPFPGGGRRGPVFGTMWHGTLENDAFRRAWLTEVAELADSPWRREPAAEGFSSRREGMINTVADAVESHVDLAAILAGTRISALL